MSDENEQIVLGGKADEIVKCAGCGKDLKVEERHSFEGENGEDIYYCDECIAQINSALEEETKNPNILFATAASIFAGIVGGFIWYWFTVLTNWQVGYLAIALGWFVGIATCFGAGHKKGKMLQAISVATTLITLLLAEFMISLHYIGKTPDFNMSSTVLLNHLLGQGYSIISLFITVIKNSISPIGLVIWCFGLYTAYIMPKARKL